ncbi:MAG TPA: hypothetical protein VEQ38_21880 [Verrucomicrobiae bacterium]|nr:hypothetical protein [Verrucomicrobiae bacterium]
MGTKLETVDTAKNLPTRRLAFSTLPKIPRPQNWSKISSASEQKRKCRNGNIARALEVHSVYVSGTESGKQNPTLATIQKLLMRLKYRLMNY